MKRLLLLLVALMGLLFLLSQLIGPGLRLEAPGVPAGENSSQTPLVSPGESDPVVLSGGEGQDAQEGGRSSLDEGPEGGNQQASAQEQHRLTGRILNERSKPVVDALITVSRSQRGMMMEMDIRPEDRSVETVRTDQGGRFALGMTEAGTRQVLIQADGYQQLTESAYVGGGRDFDLGDLVVKSGFGIQGKVLSVAGAPLEGVSVALLPNRQPGAMSMSFGVSSGVEVATTDEEGNFAVSCLPLGPYELKFTRDDLLPATSSGVLRRGVTDVLDIRQEFGAVLRGTLAQGDVPLDQLEVMAWYQEAQAPGMKFMGGDMVGPSPFDARSVGQLEEDGSFVVRGLPLDGDVQVGVFEVEKRNVPMGPVEEVPSDAQDVALTLFPSFDLTMTVVSVGDGKGISSFGIWAGFERLQPLEDEPGQVLRHHPGGRVTYTGLRINRPEGRLRVTIDAPGFASYSRTDLLPPSSGVLDLGEVRLIRAAGLRVRVVDDGTGEFLEGVKVSAYVAPPRQELPGFAGGAQMMIGGDMPFSGRGVKLTARTNGQGEVQFSGAAGEMYQVLIDHPGYAGLSQALLVTDADVLHEARLVRPCAVDVTLLDVSGQPKNGGRIEHKVKGSGMNFELAMEGPRRTDSMGRILYSDLKAGTHQFRAVEAESATGMVMVMMSMNEDQAKEPWTEVTVIPGESRSVTLRENPKSVIRGRVFLDGEPLAQCKVTFQADGEKRFFPGEGGPGDLTDGDGSFEIIGLSPGAGRLTFSHAELVMRHEQEHLCTAGEQEVDVDLVLTNVSGRVTGPDGRGLGGMQVSVSIAGRQSKRMLGVVVIGETSPTAGSATSIRSFGTPSPVVTQEDGTYALRGVRAGVELKIEAKGAVMKPAIVQLDALEPGQQKQGVDLVLTNGADLVVTRTLGDGDNIFDVRLEWAGPKPDSGRVDIEHEIMVEGSCKFTGLTPGSWLISLRDFSARDSAPPLIEPRSVQLRAGEENRVNLD
ncbi:MAG: carboxypeptidase-like regulatory domain-containing protein [Planctomycetota bacterium]|nr:carboxypeptidase-like regulatory domain-containing protein [Planctomycetota bacterium]